MRKIYLLLIVGLISFSAFGQVSKNTTLLAHWDADTFPFVGSGQYSDIWGITAADGTEYAILGSTPYIHFFDITNTSNLVEVAHFKAGGTSLWREFKSYKDHVYAVADQGTEGLIIFDISKAPVITKTNQTTQFSDRTHMPFIDEKNGRLYLAGSNTQSGGLIVLDLTKDPDNPTLLASVSLPGGYVHDLHVDDNIAYCSHGNNGLWVYDMTDPTNPVLLGNMTSYPESGYNHSTWLTKDKKYLIQCDETHGTSVKMVDVQNLSDIKVVDLFKSTLLAPGDLNSVGHNPYIRGNYGIVSYYHDGVQIYRVEDPLNVVNVGWYDTETTKTNYNGYTGNWGVYPFFESDKIIASDMLHGMFVIKLNNIDLDSIHDTKLPDVSLNYGGDVRVCKGDSILVKAKYGAQFYNWYKDGEMINSDFPFLTIKEPGDYKLVAWSHASIAESDVISFSTSDIQEPVIVNNPPAGICPGQVVPVCTDNLAPTYEWYNNGVLLPENNACLDVSEGSKLQVIAKDGSCAKQGSPLDIKQYSFPDQSLIANNTIICQGDSTYINATNNATSWQWLLNGQPIPGATTPKIVVKEEGIYTVELNNGFCSNTSDEVTITVQKPIVFSVNFDGNVLSSIQAETYQWYFNGQIILNATGMTYEPIQSGIYYVIISDLIGCVSKSDDISVMITATNNLNVKQVSLFPNPVQNELNVIFSNTSQFSDWSIINSVGAEIQTGQFIKNTANQLINTSGLASGTYILNCISSNESVKLKFIKL